MNGMRFASIPETDAYLKAALKSFIDDPPDNEFQRGYMSALIEVARQYLYWPENNETLVEARKVFNRASVK
jgi:hypothetical protein